MLDTTTKRRIDSARDILVGKVPDPKSQVEQITIALIFKFMDDMDMEAEELGGIRSFFTGEYEKYSWHKLFDPTLGGFDVLTLYSEALLKLSLNPALPQLFRDIFKNAYLPYRDPETLKSFIKIINDFNYDHSEKLGDAFEYLLSVLGSQGDAGQFRTPRHIIDFMVELIDPQKYERILDPACGTAGFLISSYKHILKNNSSNYNPAEDKRSFEVQEARIEELGALNGKHYNGDKLTPEERTRLTENISGYDISPDMVRLSLVNLYLHGFTEPHIYEYDTLTSEDRWNEYYDIVMANPPFMSPKGGIRPHKRFSVESSRSEVLFVDYIAEHLTPTGRAAIIVPEGIIFQGGTAYKQLRKMLVEENYLIGVISLPAGVFNPYSGVKTSILWIDKSLARKTDKILFLKIANDGFDLGAQRRPIKLNNLPGAFQYLTRYYHSILTNEEFIVPEGGYLQVVDCEKLAENGDYSFSGDRYTKSSFNQNSVFPLIEIGALCNLFNGLPFKPEEWETSDKGGLPIIRIQNLNNSKAEYNYYSGAVPEKNIVYSGDLLFSWSGSRGTSFGAHIWRGTKAILNQHIFKVEHDLRLLKGFLYLALNKAVEEVEQNLHGGVGLVHITKGNLEKIRIPLPPLSIQQEIVAEIEGYQKIIDGARQVVENYKPRIDIDPGWEMVQLGEVCELNPKKSEVAHLPGNTEISFIPMATINENQVNFEPKESKKISEVYSGYTYFRNNDVLVAKVTPCFENGKAGIAKELLNGIGFGSSELYVLRCSEIVESMWIYVWVTCDRFREEGKTKMTGTGGLQRVPKDFVSSFLIPLPDIDTQRLIVAQIMEEQHIVSSNKRLIEIYDQKIKDRMAKIWGS